MFRGDHLHRMRFQAPTHPAPASARAFGVGRGLFRCQWLLAAGCLLAALGQSVPVDAQQLPGQSGGVPEDDPFADELSATMQAALDRLPAQLRETLLLVVVGELTHQEAADLQGIPLGTVLSRVSRARSQLREFLLDTAPAANGQAASRRDRRPHHD